MADGPPDPRSSHAIGSNSNTATDAGSTSRTPRWVIVFGLIAILMILVFAVIHLMGGGLHAHEMP